ncbi:carbonic anhydrase [Aureimonas endophytica]|uniref:Carbonic anhydrase n=1 Tax=Aureimonas endophytica TaxID=2027858 RepID=A0A917E7E4_9HYPH|nr:carbonic anhydrase [Aureimonas endophytica]GGE06467.1 carbonic anhydrase [Aureimonas endophytica]
MALLPDHLLAGHDAFMSGRYAAEEARYRALAREGQAPETMVIACCDSRAAPEIIFDSAPGELFVVRNVANLVPPFGPNDDYHGTSAAIEFAVVGLKVKNILILGHGRCGGIKAALTEGGDPLSPADFIGRWMSLVDEPARGVAAIADLTATERQTALERISIRYSINNLRSFPYVAEREAAGELAIHGAWFDISTGELWAMDPVSGDFQRPNVDAERAA